MISRIPLRCQMISGLRFDVCQRTVPLMVPCQNKGRSIRPLPTKRNLAMWAESFQIGPCYGRPLHTPGSTFASVKLIISCLRSSEHSVYDINLEPIAWQPFLPRCTSVNSRQREQYREEEARDCLTHLFLFSGFLSVKVESASFLHTPR